MKTFIAEFKSNEGKSLFMTFSASNKTEANDHANYCVAVSKTFTVAKVTMVKSSTVKDAMMGHTVADRNDLFVG